MRRLYAEEPCVAAPHIRGARVLVTGAGGSIGSVLCHQLSGHRPELLTMLDGYDGNLYSLDQSMPKSTAHKFVVGDVRYWRGMLDIVRRYRFDYVFHVAALKHVPMLEDPLNMMEAARTNVLGTCNVIRATADMPDSVLINVSTDKAVNPSSILGLTKRCAELYTRQAVESWGMRAASVRFGNVLDSIGSVVPLFKNQIKQGGPITVTDERMTRFFMTTAQAAKLTIMASNYVGDHEARQSCCYILDSGGPVLIRALIDALQTEMGTSHDVISCGIRPGEKLHEELYAPEFEQIIDTAATAIKRVRDTSRKPDDTTMTSLISAIEERMANLTSRHMKNLVPEYVGDFSA
jgi:FlaA1/EpsC-like NDP-sugar epimerase